jgi:peptide/nickel transport system substrate-binding protein
LYESLIKYDREGKIVPGLAERWQQEEDGCTWRFYLRPGVRFHDGSFLTAEDAAASLRRACSPEMPGEYGTAALLASYLQTARISAPAPDVVQIVTAQPMADLTDLLVYAVVLPAHSLHTVNTVAPGTGPYRLAAREIETVRLERFEGYWGGPAPVENLVFVGIREEESRVRAFLNHEVDLITYMPTRHSPAFASCPDAALMERSNPLCVILMCNSFSGPCADRRVRQALNYATDVPALVQHLYSGKAFPLNGPLSRHHSGTDPDLPPYQHDPAQARRLLAEAGYPDGLTITLDRPTKSPDESAELAHLLAGQWRAAGITLVERVHENREQYALRVRNKDIADLCVFDSSPMSTFRILLEKLNSNFAGPWWEGYQNAEVNALMERAWRERDETRRVALYREAYRLVRDDAPWVFLYSPVDMWVAQKNILERLPGWGAGVDGLVLFGQGYGKG